MPLPAIKTDSKSLGIVQMMIGVVILSFGFLLNNVQLNNLQRNNVPPNNGHPFKVHPNNVQPLCVRSKAMYWGSICFLIAGSLSVSAVDHRNPFVVKSTLVMNLLSALAAVPVIIMLSVDLKDWRSDEKYLVHNEIFHPCNGGPDMDCLLFITFKVIQGTYIVLVLFSTLEVFMAIWTFVLLWKSRNN